MKRLPQQIGPEDEPCEVIDLCDSSPTHPLPTSHPKRRRLASLPKPPVIDLSDEERESDRNADAQLAQRLQDEERERADEELARSLHAHEFQRSVLMMGGGMPPVPRGYPFGARRLFSGLQPSNAFRPELLLFDNTDVAWRSGAAMLPPPPPLVHSWHRRMPLGGLRAGSRLAHLSMMDRDFGEADYEMLLSLDDDNDDSREKKSKMRENSKLVDQLPSHRASRTEAREERACAICLENIRVQQTVTTLPCKHEYHRNCISKWLKSIEAASCPQCKAPALEPPPSSTASTATVNDPDAGAAATTTEQWWHT
ncbi:hypothetical protein AB1Y20_021752 [Prymnesium parvum]